MNIKYNINKLIEKLPAACKLVAVSKTQPPDKVLEAYEAGQRLFGENKVQELTQKQASLPGDIEWHMIGHLQRNKVKYIVPFVSLIHSVDNEKVLEEINKQGWRISRVIPCLLQVHIAEEETKFGFTAGEVEELLKRRKFGDYKHILIRGLMGMATFTDDHDKVRREFKGLHSLFEDLRISVQCDNVSLTELSMGMSNDYEIAAEEGSTMVRIGSAIFGERLSNKT